MTSEARPAAPPFYSCRPGGALPPATPLPDPMRTLLTVLALALALVAPRAEAQCTGTPVTARQINTIPQANVDFLMANAASLTPAQIIENVNTSPYLNQEVQFTAVVLSEPYNSGLASIVANTGLPGRVHVFVRDVSALSEGVAGMSLQIVDGRGNGEIFGFFPGDEIVVCGIVTTFTSAATGAVTLQISPSDITATGTVYDETSPLRQPVLVTPDDFHNVVNGLTQIDWSRYAEFNSQFVRIESTSLVQGIPGARPNMLFESTTGGAQVNSYDTSLRYRNDRACSAPPPSSPPFPNCYPNPPYNTRPGDDPFVPPATGVVNIQGFLVSQGWGGGFNYSTPNGANFSIAPMEDSDFEVAVAPPIVVVNPITGTPTSGGPVTVTASITPGTAGNTIASATINWQLQGGTVSSVPMTNTGGDTWSGQIPAQANGAFVGYTVTAVDNQGATFTSPLRSFRVLDGPITSIELIQRTFSGQPGPSPLYTGTNNNPGATVAFNLNAVVQSLFQDRGGNWVGTFQDDATLQPWTGIWAFFGATQPTLAVGDRVTITQAAINERFEVTQLESITFNVTAPGTPYGDKVVTTDLFIGTAGRAVAEAHEGMMLRFDNVTITDVNADGPDEPGSTPNFGEWGFSSTGSAAAQLRADDLSNAFPANWNQDNLAIGRVHSFHRGAMFFGFANYKLVPPTLADVGMVVSTEAGAATGVVRIAGTFPNPSAGTARVRFELDRPGAARLSVVDALGREVAVLADGTFATGAHDAALDARALAPGVYVLRLVADDAVATARLSVVR